MNMIKLYKVILIINGENYNCSMTFIIPCQNIKNSFTDRYKCIGNKKENNIDLVYTVT